MQKIVMVLAAIVAAVVGRSVHDQAAENSIKQDVSPRQVPLRRFVSLTRRPPPTHALSASGDDMTELTCEAIGAPAPTIHWYKNDAPVYENEVKASELLETSPWSLGRVTSTLLVKRGQHGRYTCVAVAGVMAARATTHVYTKQSKSSTELSEHARLTPLSPRILVTYKVYMDVSGSTVILPCKARGHPRPYITWTTRKSDNQEQPIKPDTNERIKVLRSGELMISDLSWSDMGEYVCHASNANGSQSATTFVYPAKAG